MTPTELQDMLVAEIEKILAGHPYRRPDGSWTAMRVYPQHLPINQTDEEDEDPVPYVIVRLNSGEDEGSRDSENTVRLVVIIGLWDDDPAAQGHRDVMSIIEKLYIRFQKDPSLGGKAVHSGEFQWAMQEDSYFPYFFGACTLNFKIAAIRREDALA